MSDKRSDNARIRDAILEALPWVTSNYGETPSVGQVYVPPSHLKALRLDCALVVGARGVGKSFWASALTDKDVRDRLGASISPLRDAEVCVGFGPRPRVKAYPGSDAFSQLLGESYTPYDIWRAVLVRQAPDAGVEPPLPRTTWRETTDWVVRNPEAVDAALERMDAQARASHQSRLFVFDALDRTSQDWRTMDLIVRDLLRVVLLLNAYPTLYGKVFLREDQCHRTVTDFPDASKLLATRVDLSWAPHDLHGLLWHMLCNAPDAAGTCLRDLYQTQVGRAPIAEADFWRLTEDGQREGAAQRRLFEGLAGPWMGRDRRRGVPYVWSVGHLADARGETSPRSFLAAIRTAAEDSQRRALDGPYPLHYDSIKRGVQKASKVRVAEMAEDYPWVRSVMEPLAGMTVPCDPQGIMAAWSDFFAERLTLLNDPGHLPPPHLEEGWLGICKDLERLGLFAPMRDGRINMPDLYRIGFGLGRRGGVKPTR